MENFKNQIKLNKNSWNKRTPIHFNSKFYDVEKFIKGGSSLKKFEIDALGDLNSKSVLHLQCHFGQDSLSLARLGAEVTGVDFSQIAIEKAKSLSKTINTPASFVLSDVMTLELGKEFDIVFTSYGTIGWLPDLDAWAKTIYKHLKKGGLFVFVEFHPFIDLLHENRYDYFFKPMPDQEIEHGTYTDGGEDLVHENCWWNHSLTEIFGALENNGLILKYFEEHNYSPYPLKGYTEIAPGRYVLSNRKEQSLPYTFTLKAVKK